MIRRIRNSGARARAIVLAVAAIVAARHPAVAQGATPQLVTFASGDLALKGYLWKPDGQPPFPAILWNHGSERLPGTADTVASYFVSRGYVFFVPHRRGQGRSPGRYIMDQLNAAGSPDKRGRLLVSLNEAHLQDQLAALAYLKQLNDVDQNRLVAMGASFGGIQTMLALEGDYGYRVAIACSTAAQTWRRSPALRARLITAARKPTMPVFLFQAENDYDLTPNRVLADEIRRAGVLAEVKTYPASGSGPQEGHNFCWTGTNIWGPDVDAFIAAH